MAQFCAPASCPAKSAFFLLRAMGRIVRSTVLLSISIRPSPRNRISPFQYLSIYFSAAPVGDLAETCRRALWAAGYHKEVTSQKVLTSSFDLRFSPINREQGRAVTNDRFCNQQPDPSHKRNPPNVKCELMDQSVLAGAEYHPRKK